MQEAMYVDERTQYNFKTYQHQISFFIINPVAMGTGVSSMIVVLVDTPAVLLHHGLSSLSCDLNGTRGICAPWFIATCGVQTHGLYHRNSSCTNVLRCCEEEQ